jgi:hypothetical protein
MFTPCLGTIEHLTLRNIVVRGNSLAVLSALARLRGTTGMRAERCAASLVRGWTPTADIASTVERGRSRGGAQMCVCLGWTALCRAQQRGHPLSTRSGHSTQLHAAPGDSLSQKRHYHRGLGTRSGKQLSHPASAEDNRLLHRQFHRGVASLRSWAPIPCGSFPSPPA